MQLSKPAWAARYEAAQKGDGGGMSLEAALRDMGSGDDGSLEVAESLRGPIDACPGS